MSTKYKSVVFANSLPKSGTNLLQKALGLLGYEYANLGIADSLINGKFPQLRKLVRGNFFGNDSINLGLDSTVTISGSWLNRRLQKLKPGEYISGHANYSEYLNFLLNQHNIKKLLIIRDPRDVLVSWVHHVRSRQDHMAYNYLNEYSFEQSISLVLAGFYINDSKMYIESFSSVLRKINPWVHLEDVLLIKFEDLVGEMGGGSSDIQLTTIQKIFRHVSLYENEFDDTFFEEVAEQLFGGTHTFRKGLIGSWKDELSQEMVTKIESNLSDFLNHWDYK